MSNNSDDDLLFADENCIIPTSEVPDLQNPNLLDSSNMPNNQPRRELINDSTQQTRSLHKNHHKLSKSSSLDPDKHIPIPSSLISGSLRENKNASSCHTLMNQNQSSQNIKNQQNLQNSQNQQMQNQIHMQNQNNVQNSMQSNQNNTENSNFNNLSMHTMTNSKDYLAKLKSDAIYFDNNLTTNSNIPRDDHNHNRLNQMHMDQQQRSVISSTLDQNNNSVISTSLQNAQNLDNSSLVSGNRNINKQHGSRDQLHVQNSDNLQIDTPNSPNIGHQSHEDMSTGSNSIKSNSGPSRRRPSNEHRKRMSQRNDIFLSDNKHNTSTNSGENLLQNQDNILSGVSMDRKRGANLTGGHISVGYSKSGSVKDSNQNGKSASENNLLKDSNDDLSIGTMRANLNTTNRNSHKQTSKVSKRINLTEHKSNTLTVNSRNQYQSNEEIETENIGPLRSTHNSATVPGLGGSMHQRETQISNQSSHNSGISSKEPGQDLKSRNLSILSTQSLPMGMSKERITALEHSINDMFNKMNENRAKAGRPFDVDQGKERG
jgi:hypothetical protein